MAQAYFSLITNTGRIKLAQSAAGGPAIVITHFAIGDGNGAETNPTAATTALVREVWRAAVDSVIPDPDNPSAILVTTIIPTTSGGWWMREFGIFDTAGDMIAVAKPVSQYKPTALEGQLEDIRYEFQIIVGENANVTLLVDPSIQLASREWVINRRIPMVQLLSTPFVPVKSMTVTAPPGAPAQGDLYAIPAAATGAWAGHAQKLAEWDGSAWRIITTPNGHMIGLPDGTFWIRQARAYVRGPQPLPDTAYGTLINDGAGGLTFAGRPLYTGAADPIAGNGINGAMWLNTATGTIWGPKAAGAWPGSALPVPYHVHSLPVLASPGPTKPIAASDGTANRRITIAQIAELTAATDAVFSDMFFLGSL